MGFILAIIFYILILPVAVINFIAVLIKFTKSRGFFKVVDDYWFQSALDGDIFANHHFRTLWNMTLIKKQGYQFGNRLETISSVLGKNQRDKTLRKRGWALVIILWAIDWKYWRKGGHCINSIQEF